MITSAIVDTCTPEPDKSESWGGGQERWGWWWRWWRRWSGLRDWEYLATTSSSLAWKCTHDIFSITMFQTKWVNYPMVFKAVVNLPLDLTAPLTTLPNDGNAAHLSAIKLQALQSLPGPQVQLTSWLGSQNLIVICLKWKFWPIFSIEI